MTEKQNPPKENQINIELPENVAEGTYSNLAIITHSDSEFVIDFVRIMPGVPQARVKSRIVLTPQHAKRLIRALGENMSKYEGAHGPVEESTSGIEGFPINFGPAGEA
ncbi:MAG: DUF3467 domain-containing protein [Bacteroidota bacterium]|nr:DUF3467 domain-containing protein [Bacteroidota bacterium]